MSKTYFIESRFPAYATRPCDTCGLVILKVQEGKMYWNPSRNAKHRNICQNCFDAWKANKQANWQKWRDAHAAIQPQAGQIDTVLEQS